MLCKAVHHTDTQRMYVYEVVTTILPGSFSLIMILLSILLCIIVRFNTYTQTKVYKLYKQTLYL